jgi:hypothetical protein
MAKPITDATIAQITRNLVQFGYEGLTEEVVQREVDNLTAGGSPTNAIGMFTRGMLIENGYIEEG